MWTRPIATVAKLCLLLLALAGCQTQSAQPLNQTSTAAVVNPTATATQPFQGRVRPTQEPYCKTFSETSYKVCDEFIPQWEMGGERLRFGLPLSDWFYEVGENGEIYRVQYFEQHVIRLERSSVDIYIPGWYKAPRVPLGKTVYNRKYPNGAPGQVANKTGRAPVLVNMNLDIWMGGRFAEFYPNSPNVKIMDTIDWIGMPISNEFTEKNELDGKEYKVQYFEEAALEYHPENQPPDDVKFVPLGLYEFKHRYPNGTPSIATPTPHPYTTSEPGWGCYRQNDLPPSKPTPVVSLSHAEATARAHYSNSPMNNGQKLGSLNYSKHVSVDITNPQSDIEILRDAWHLSFLIDVPTPTPYPTSIPGDVFGVLTPTSSYVVYVDAETGQVLPGCEWVVTGAP